MTTLASPSSPWQSIGSKNSENLEDRFWAAFNLDDVEPLNDRDDAAYPAVGYPSPMAFVKPNLPRLVDQNEYGCNHLTASPARAKYGCSGPSCQEQRRERKNTGSLKLKVPPPRLFSVTLSPTTAFPLSASTTRPQWHLPTPGVIRPSTPALELVSNFLDSMVRLSDSRSSTPAAAVTVGEGGGTLIVESEVLVQFIEDAHRTAMNSPVEVRKGSKIAKLQIPTVPGAAGYDMIPSATVANGPAGCAQELDALSWMSWDRQLSNVQHGFWY